MSTKAQRAAIQPASYRAIGRELARLAQRVVDLAEASEPRQVGARTRAINVLSREAKYLQTRNAFGDPDPAAFVDGALHLDRARINDLRAAAGRAAAGAPQDYRIDELEGPLLDLAVSKAIGLDAVIYLVPNAIKPFHECCVLNESGHLQHQYMPSRSWINGGPLIEQHRIEVFPEHEPEEGTDSKHAWWAMVDAYDGSGPAPLIAAMRSLCRAHFGKTVRM